MPPNIVLLLADDLGYGDVGFHGSDIHTPHLDQLARDGVRLEQFHVAPMCSPTRAGLMTGRYPIRFGMMRSVIPPPRDYGLDPAEDTLPEMLARAGYSHRACIGKWHLGHRRKKWHPTEQGFTHFIGCYNGAIDYFTHERDGQLDFHQNEEPYRVKGYVTDILADEAVAFIDSVPKGEPYFLYVPFTAPHSPFQAKEADLARYPHREGRRRTYAAMVDCLDQGIGRILEAIDSRGERANTLVLFASDNGGVNAVGDNGPQRGAKLTPYEGGIRVAAILRWPESGLREGTMFDQHIGYIDVMPTLKEAVGVKDDPVRPFDGQSFLTPMIEGKPLPDRAWFTYLDQNNQKQERLAVNHGRRKLVVHRPAPDGDSSAETTIELFHLANDPGERRDLFNEERSRGRALLEELAQFYRLKRTNQVARYSVGQRGFSPPTDWIIDR